MSPWFEADPLKIQKKNTLEREVSKSYRSTVQAKELRSSGAVVPEGNGMISPVHPPKEEAMHLWTYCSPLDPR